MSYRIYPPLGIARLGNSQSSYYFGPERPDSNGTELDPAGNEAEVDSFKDAQGKVKRMAARFRLFEFDAASPSGRLAQLPTGAVVRWSVQIANIKDAVTRTNGPTPQNPTVNPQFPHVIPPHPVVDAALANRQITSKKETFTGANAATITFSGTYLKGDLNSKQVILGEAFTDKDGNLIVLGGHGMSGSPEGKPIGAENGGGGFYNNRGWFDDVADGSIAAEIVFPGGQIENADPAWLMVAPPDFAPGIKAPVTLYDVLLQLAISKGWASISARPEFLRDIKPIIVRTRQLRWVHQTAAQDWSQVSNDWLHLSSSALADKPLRQTTAGQIRKLSQALRNYRLQEWQNKYLSDWVNGEFDNTPNPPVSEAGRLLRSVLDGTVGQGFLPGIEAGVLLLDHQLYSQPFDFRLSHSAVKPGWLTALMALPWQADFLECSGRWWPSQRPDWAPQMNGVPAPWSRPLDDTADHRLMTENQFVMGLGVVTPRPTAGDPERQVEEGADFAVNFSRKTSALVLGGGVAGSTVALGLARAGWRVTVLERQSAPQPRPGETLPPDVTPLLRRLGVWDDFLAAKPVESPGNLSLWGSDEPGATDFIFSPHGCGWHVERGTFDNMLLHHAKRAGVAVRSGANVFHIEQMAGGWDVRFRDDSGQHRMEADWLVFANGRGGGLLPPGVVRQRTDNLIACFALSPANPALADLRTWTEAASEGWWYSAPVPGDQLALAYFTDANLLPSLLSERHDYLRSCLGETTLMRQRAEGTPQDWRVVDARTGWLTPCGGERWLAVGDAAFSIDPLSSSGIGFALESGMRAADEILSGSLSGLSGLYARWLSGQRESYFAEHRLHYRAEQRWPGSPFWKRRHSGNESFQMS